MNLTYYSVPISPWRIWRVMSSKFMTPVWHGWTVRISALTHKLVLSDKRQFKTNLMISPETEPLVCKPCSSLLPLPRQIMKWLSAPEKGTSCRSASTPTSPRLSWTTAHWWVIAARPMRGQISVLIGLHSQTAGQIVRPTARGCFQLEKERNCRVPLFHIPRFRPKKDLAEWQYQLIFPPIWLFCEPSTCAFKENFLSLGIILNTASARHWQTYMGHHRGA